MRACRSSAVARDAIVGGDVLAVVKVRRHQGAQAAKREAEGGENVVIEAMRPIDIRIEAKNIARVYKAEDVGAVAASVLKGKATVELIALAGANRRL